MSKLRVHNFAISLDGYGAGPRQTLENPLGVGGEDLHGWFVGTRAFREIHGQTGGTTGPDNDFAKRFMEGGTVFHFVTGGIQDALQRAREAAGDLDIQIGGGTSTVRQYLEAQVIDDLHVAIAPILLGSGEAL